MVDPEYLKERKVFGHVLAAFRYGREDLDVLGERRNLIHNFPFDWQYDLHCFQVGLLHQKH